MLKFLPGFGEKKAAYFLKIIQGYTSNSEDNDNKNAFLIKYMQKN
jgi:hypothetical protein